MGHNGSQNQRDMAMKVKHREIQHCCLWRQMERPQANECGQPLYAGKGKETDIHPEPAEATNLPNTLNVV